MKLLALLLISFQTFAVNASDVDLEAQAKAAVARLIAEWNPPPLADYLERGHGVYTNARGPAVENFFEIAKADDGMGGWALGIAAHHQIAAQKDNEDALFKLISIALLGSRVYFSGGAGLQNETVSMLDKLMDAKYAGVRMAAAQLQLAKGRPVRGGSHAHLENRRESHYVTAFFSETDPEAKAVLRKLVALWDPEALKYGPRGWRRVLRKFFGRPLTCETALSRNSVK